MKEFISILGFILLIVLVTISFYSVNKSLEEEVLKGIEYAYFEGQKDALDGDIRIDKDKDSCWIWIKSQWDSGKAPIFDPSFNCENLILNRE